MISVDLVTGFLGTGKTSFILKYAQYLTSQGIHVGIIENDFGAINVDMLLLQDLQGDLCDVEQIVGGAKVEDWKRRFRAKLISMAMRGFERIIVEPSGIYDVESFFDVLREDTIERWYTPGSIIAVVEPVVSVEMPKEARYLLATQLLNAGVILFGKMDMPHDTRDAVTNRLREILEEFHADCSLGEELIWNENNLLLSEDFEKIKEAGWRKGSLEKLWFQHTDAFDSLFFMEEKIDADKIDTILDNLFGKKELGEVFRVKGFLPLQDGNYRSVNATSFQREIKTVSQGQEILIVIGQNLEKEKIRDCLCNMA